MERKNKEQFEEIKTTYLEVISEHIEKYRSMLIVLSSFVAAIALFFTIFWNFDNNSAGVTNDYLYLSSYIVFLILSIMMITFLVLNGYKKVSTRFLTIWIHIYAFLLVVWATLVCVLDLNIGLSPIIYFLVATTIAGLFIIEPFFYMILVILSFSSILICATIFDYPYFSAPYVAENIFNFFIFSVLVVLICFRHFKVIIKEYKTKKALEKLTYFDELTDLLNERSYMNEVDKINENIENDRQEDFAIIMMDVNNLKVTNDTYGHRYGCHLIVRAGHMLPDLFKSSKVFHVGGDEFIAIVYKEDFAQFDKIIENFDNTFSYSIIEYEGHELIFSIARGYSIYQKGDKYHDTFKRADVQMYENKKMLKEKYNMKGR